jgi:hypothetical protein
MCLSLPRHVRSTADKIYIHVMCRVNIKKHWLNQTAHRLHRKDVSYLCDQLSRSINSVWQETQLNILTWKVVQSHLQSLYVSGYEKSNFTRIWLSRIFFIDTETGSKTLAIEIDDAATLQEFIEPMTSCSLLKIVATLCSLECTECRMIDSDTIWTERVISRVWQMDLY